MSTEYPVYNNKPIDQWKVTELKEELRRRKLKINGLKEELVRRLDESLRSEITSDPEEELGNGTDSDNDPQNNVDGKDSDPPPAEKNAEHDEDQSKKVDDDDAMVDVDNNTSDVHQGAKDDGQKETTEATTDVAFEEMSAKTVPVHSMTDDQNAVTQLRSNNQEASYDEKSKESKPPAEDVKFTPSETANQVSEVNPDLGFQVKCESISTDSVLINEKPKLKDNLNANNVHLELEVVKLDMVQPSSGDVPTIGVDLHPLEDDKELVDNQGSLEEVGDVTCTMGVEHCKKTDSVDVGSAEILNFDRSSGAESMPTIGVDLHPLEDDKMLVDNKGSLEEVGDATCTVEGEHHKKTDSVDVGSPEKLNFDRSSGDESMEEDVLESKQVESKNYSEIGGRNEDSKAMVVQVVSPVDAMVGGFPPEKKDMAPEDGNKPIAPVEKRKAKDQETVATIEPKRQRRLNSETIIKAPEAQTSYITATTPKDVFQPSLRRSLSRTDSSLSGEAPKERVVPPPLRAATTSLRINNFLRPFTLKAVQELLGKTGTFSDFWMDHIKTHCYVTYPSVEEAIATRNALYNLQWPSNGGRFLTAEFVDPQEVKTRLEAPQSSAPVISSPTIPTASPFQPQTQAMQPPRNPLRQQQLPPPPPLPPPPALSNPLPVRERLPPPPPPPKKPEPSILTLDDLFKKTIATPRIYYLPLSEEQVAARLVNQGKRAQEGQ